MSLIKNMTAIRRTAARIASPSYKSRLSFIVAIMIVFTSFTAFSPSQSKEFKINDGEKTYNIVCAADNAEDVIAAAGLKLGKTDVASFDDEDVSTVNVARRCKITISYKGEMQQLIVLKNSVEDVLKRLNISAKKDETVTPELNKTVSDGMTVQVDKTTYKQDTTTEQVSYDKYLTLLKDGKTSSDKIEKTSNKIKVTRKYKITYVNGEKTKSELTQQKFEEIIPAKTTSAATTKTASTSTQSSAKSTTASTKSTSSSSSAKSTSSSVYNPDNAISPLVPSKDIELDKNGAPVSYKTVYTGIASAYSGDEWTASGRRAGVGYIAVNPNVIPYGTKLYIRSTDGKYTYGYAIAADTGGFVNMGRIADLYFSTESQCVNFGLRNVEIYVLS